MLLINHTLTTKGIALCLVLAAKDYQSCEKALRSTLSQLDPFGGNGPVMMLSAKDSPSPIGDVVGYHCVEWAVFAEAGGSFGEYYCTRPMAVAFEKGRWKWTTNIPCP